MVQWKQAIQNLLGLGPVPGSRSQDPLCRRLRIGVRIFAWQLHYDQVDARPCTPMEEFRLKDSKLGRPPANDERRPIGIISGIFVDILPDFLCSRRIGNFAKN